MKQEVVTPAPIGAFIAAVNGGDESGFLDAFADDGFVDDWGRKFVGREAIKAWSDKEFIGAKGTLTPQKVMLENGAVVVIGDWRSNHANGLSRFEFILNGERLSSMTIREG